MADEKDGTIRVKNLGVAPLVCAVVCEWPEDGRAWVTMEDFEEAKRLVEQAAAELREQGVVAVGICPPPGASIYLQAHPMPSELPVDVERAG